MRALVAALSLGKVRSGSFDANHAMLLLNLFGAPIDGAIHCAGSTLPQLLARTMVATRLDHGTTQAASLGSPMDPTHSARPADVRTRCSQSCRSRAGKGAHGTQLRLDNQPYLAGNQQWSGRGSKSRIETDARFRGQRSTPRDIRRCTTIGRAEEISRHSVRRRGSNG